MSKLKNIFKLAELNNKTNGLSYKDFKRKMKSMGVKNGKDPIAKGYFYINEPNTTKLQNIQSPQITLSLVLPEVENISPKVPTNNSVFTGTFNEAFRNARKAGLKTFTWNGKLYGTELATNQPTEIPVEETYSETPMSFTKNSLGLFVPSFPSFRSPTYYTKALSGKVTKYTIIPDLIPEDVSTLIESYSPNLSPITRKTNLSGQFVPSFSKIKSSIESEKLKLAEDIWNNKYLTIGNMTVTKFYAKGGSLNKFQQGGQAQLSSLNDAVMLFVQAIALTLQTDPQQIIAAAQANPEALKSAVQVYQLTLDIQQAALTFAQAINAKTQAAKHGAKLDYLKSLKHLCAEDEELIYFKKGGKAGCGCKKKEDCGKMEKDKKDSPVKRFKMARGGQTPEKKSNKKSNKLDQASIDSTLVNKYDDLEILASRPGYYIPNPNKGKNGDERELIWVPDRSKAPYKKEVKTEACGGKMKKESCGGAAKFKADKCGGKMKKHLLGGSLNGIPFIKKVQLKTV